MKLLHEATLDVLKPLTPCEKSRFDVCEQDGNIKCTCFWVITSYSCDILEVKYMSSVKHGLTVKRSCVGCVVTTVYIQNLKSRHRRWYETRKVARDEEEEALSQVLLSP